MNQKQLIKLLLVGLVLGGLGLYLFKKDKASYQTSESGGGQKPLAGLPVNDIAQIRIQHAPDEVNLIRGDDAWKVKERANYAANYGEIRDLLLKLTELKVVQTVTVGPSQYARLELLEPGKATNGTGTLVEFKDKSGKTISTVTLGKRYNKETKADPMFGGGGDMPVGRYILVNDPAPRVVLVSDPLSSLEPRADTWVNKDFFKVEKIKSIAVTHPEATNSWTLTREKEGGDLKLADTKPGESLDASKASGAGSALSFPSFTDVTAPDTKPEITGLDKPVTATIETFEGFTYTVKIGKADALDNYHVTVSVNADYPKTRTAPADEKKEDKEKLDKEFKDKLAKLDEKLKLEKALDKWIYLVGKWSVEPILKTRKDLMADKKEPAADAPKAEAKNPFEVPVLGTPK